MNKQQITLHNEISDSGKLSDFLREHSKVIKLPEDSHNDLRLVCEEVFINIVSYAYKKEDRQVIKIEISSNTDDISLTFTDTGIAFNPLTDNVQCKDGDDHCDGGMGIRLITSLTDHQAYRRVGQSNVFTVTKHYTKQNTEK